MSIATRLPRLDLAYFYRADLLKNYIDKEQEEIPQWLKRFENFDKIQLMKDVFNDYQQAVNANPANGHANYELGRIGFRLILLKDAFDTEAERNDYLNIAKDAFHKADELGVKSDSAKKKYR